MVLPLLLGLSAAATPLTIGEGSIRVDGVVDDQEWLGATVVEDFTRFEPTAGGAPNGSTTVRMAHDSQNVYFGIRVEDAGYDIRARVSPREEINADDQIGIYLDTFRDQRSGYVFYFNPVGVQQDIRVSIGSFNMSFDTVVRSRGRVTETGYELEVAIPFRSLKYQAGGEQEWGLILTRKIPSEGAKYSFPKRQRRHPRLFSQAIPVRLRAPSRGTGLEIQPSLTVSQTGSRDSTADPLQWTGLSPWNEAIRPSLDLRFGITPTIGLALAVNPDFSQVEGDVTPIALNQRFAFFFRERRPFFLDGSDYFRDLGEMLYSRSIANPLYGLKVSGQQGRVSVGVTHALDMDVGASFHEGETPGFEAEEVEDTVAENTMARVKYLTFGKGYVGLTFGDKRILDARDLSSRASWTGAALDLSVPLGSRWVAEASTTQSWTGRSGESRMWGQQVQASIERSSGVGTGFELVLSDATAGLRKEMGFLNQSALTTLEMVVDHTFEPEGILNRITPALVVEGLQERNGDAIRRAGAEVDAVLAGIHRVEVTALADQRVEGDAQVLGWTVGAEYEAELTALVETETELEFGRTIDYDTLSPIGFAIGSVGVSLRPTAGIRIDTTFSGEHQGNASQGYERAGRIRSRLTWQFTRELGLRVIEEITGGNQRDGRLLSSVLLTWLKSPGTAVHLGYTEETQLSGKRGATIRGVFAKASVLFRP